MPTIRSSAQLRNHYNEISEFCHEHSEPVFITKNGNGDLAVLSIAAYEKLTGKFELYRLLGESVAAEQKGDVHPFPKTLDDILKGLER
jgi:prevent-host-death family protein